jgi:hypothetical protein
MTVKMRCSDFYFVELMKYSLFTYNKFVGAQIMIMAFETLLYYPLVKSYFVAASVFMGLLTISPS